MTCHFHVSHSSDWRVTVPTDTDPPPDIASIIEQKEPHLVSGGRMIQFTPIQHPMKGARNKWWLTWTYKKKWKKRKIGFWEVKGGEGRVWV
jgi:hypothetical protein